MIQSNLFTKDLREEKRKQAVHEGFTKTLQITMDILILGSGGREHTLALAYSKSKRVKKVHVAPGNGLMDFQNEKITIHPQISVLDLSVIIEFVQKENIDLVDVAQDDPLALGFVDKLQKLGIACFGPTQKAAEIEWSKDWARNFMQKYHLPIPIFKSFNNQKWAIAYVRSLKNQVFYIKASGLAAGKGAIRANNKNEAIEAIKSMKQFGKAGETFLIEECLVGEEFSLFALCDGENYVIAKTAQDHKTIYEADRGPNTGGMGCVAPTGLINPKIIKEIEVKILKPFMKGMREEKRSYSGVLYLGGVLTHPPAGGGAKVIEFNARWGDPEAQVILPSIKTDYVNIVEAVAMETIQELPISFDNMVRISVAGCSRGYPGDYSAVKGKEVFGLNAVLKLPKITVFGAGIKREGKRFFVDGGRVFHLVAEGKDINQARRRAYEAMSMIYIDGNNLHFRTDIGWREVKRHVSNDN